jgi:excisionase family DNA binding protein
MQPDLAAPTSLLSIKDVQATTKLSRSAVYELLSDGQIASVKVGRRRLVKSADLAAWIHSLGASNPSTHGREPTSGGRP